MVGSSILKLLKKDKTNNIITRNSNELNLISQNDVYKFFEQKKIDEVYIAAAKVGGIHANNIFPAQFIFENLMIESNIIHASYLSGVKKLLFLGSSCIYPRECIQPIKEEYLLNGKLELTNEPYAIAKIAGIKLCESYNRQYEVDYRSVMPTNLYGPGDNFHKENSHVIPALIRKFHEAKENNNSNVKIWGSGQAYREFLYVDDMAEASIYIMNLNKETYDQSISDRCSHINIGSGEDLKIYELAYLIKEVVGFSGNIVFDDKKPDGTLRKLLDVSLIKKLGWTYSIDLKRGLKKTYEWYLSNEDSIRNT